MVVRKLVVGIMVIENTQNFKTFIGLKSNKNSS